MTTVHKSGKPRVYEMLEEPSGDYIDVVEKSAYDRLEAMCEKMADVLSGCYHCWETTEDPHPVEKALAEYRAMKGENEKG